MHLEVASRSKLKLRPDRDLARLMIKTVIRYFPVDENTGLPAIIVQVICWTGSYMVWAGTTDEAIDEQDTTRIAGLVEEGRLGRDWACAMPSPKVDARTGRED
jgi:hypothetical protein